MMPRLNAARVLWAGIALVISGCVALGALNAYQVAKIAPQITQNRALVVHAFDVITSARALYQAVQDAERGERGFVITGDDLYLGPYRRGVEEAPVLLRQLKQLTADNAEQRQRISSLQDQIDYRL